MAKGPNDLKRAATPPRAKLSPEDVKKTADKFEVLIDGWLDNPDPSAPPRVPPLVVPYRVEDPDVLAELVARYVKAGWAAASSGLALTLALPKKS